MIKHDGFIGEGTLYIQRLDRKDLGMVRMGNATELSVSSESEVRERISRERENYGAVLNSVAIPKSGELKIVLDDFNIENFAMVFMGSLKKEEMRAQTVSDELVARIDARLDRVAHGNFGDHKWFGDIGELRFFFRKRLSHLLHHQARRSYLAFVRWR